MKVKRGRPPVVRNAVLTQLHEAKIATAVDLGHPVAYLDSLVRGGYIKRSGSTKVTPGRGRPRVQFRLTDKGRGRARRLVAA